MFLYSTKFPAFRDCTASLLTTFSPVRCQRFSNHIPVTSLPFLQFFFISLELRCRSWPPYFLTTFLNPSNFVPLFLTFFFPPKSLNHLFFSWVNSFLWSLIATCLRVRPSLSSLSAFTLPPSPREVPFESEIPKEWRPLLSFNFSDDAAVVFQLSSPAERFPLSI